ncbi:MAG: thymidine phosphorylase [Firmicutes bacterium]|nr:thymidine phosphorylase [Bacillota bacterium]
MNILHIIDHKVKQKALTKEMIIFFVQGYSKGTIPDYQISALLMAIKLNGMNDQETAWLTEAMVSSGETVDLSGIEGTTVDKHSTGGVGDKTSLVVGPIVAALGLKLAKMSGRGLGHTGGTIDKLESIPGFTTNLASARFKKQVNEVGMAIIGQTLELVPADKKLYALRDVTGTVESIPLISSSIMSKKIASGAKAILLDVKFGSGAFMKTIESAKILAKAMVNIGQSLGRDTRAMITDMDQPLGFAIGNRNEVLEAADTLQMKGPQDLLELSIQATSKLLIQAKKSDTMKEARSKVMEVLSSGKAYAKFIEFITAQGGNFEALKQPALLKTKYEVSIKANQPGYLRKIDALALGQAASLLGAGRLTKEASIDPNAGIMLHHKIGDRILSEDYLATLKTNLPLTDDTLQMIKNAFTVSTKPSKPSMIVHAWIES